MNGFMKTGTGKTLRHEDVYEELERILTSSAFEASERKRQFLRFVVEETLSGRADRIKAYTIATSVFGRGDDFDPMQDSIVRIEAAGLRRAIERFYLTQGVAGGSAFRSPKAAIPRSSEPPATALKLRRLRKR